MSAPETPNATALDLLQRAKAAMAFAYCPYSNFPVGAALLCDDGTIVTGCNVENASYGGTVCAERTAVTKAISEGKRSFTAIAVVTCERQVAAAAAARGAPFRNRDEPIAPCGMCRQIMIEFGNFGVHMASNNLEVYAQSTTSSLLQREFSGKYLEAANNLKPRA